MKTMISLTIALGFVLCLNAQTPSCSIANDVVTKMRKSAQGLNFQQPYERWIRKSNETIKKYNRAVGNKNNTTGPNRSLKFGGISVRTIRKQGTHTLVTVPAYENSLDFTINKLGGKGKIGITVCSSKGGRVNKEYSVTFDSSPNTATRTLTINNTKGKVIRFIIKHYSGSDPVEYRIASTTSAPQTPPCSAGSRVASKMWSAYGKWSRGLSVREWKAKANQAVNKFNNTVRGKNQSFKFGEILNSPIAAKEFHTITTPPAFKGSVEFTFIKFGRGEAGITICTSTKGGQPQNAYSYQFAESDTNTTRKFNISNTKGKVITILIRNYSRGKTFDYQLKD